MKFCALIFRVRPAPTEYHRSMANERWALWLVWAVMLVGIALDVALPLLLPPPSQPWYEARAQVVRFVLALLSLSAGVGTFALRETLVMRGLRAGVLDPMTPQGLARVRATLIVLWALCELIGVFGLVVSLGSGRPTFGWPFAVASVVLLILHRPHAAWLSGSGSVPDPAGLR